MEDYITKECIIEEYLNNWFTYDELAEYLCIDKNKVVEVLDNYCTLDNKLNSKVSEHRDNINKYYDTLDDNLPLVTKDNELYIDIANYIIENKSSVRETAKVFGIGKTTIHDYIQKRLPNISIKHYKAVFDVLMENKSFSTNNKRVIEQVLTSYNYLSVGNTIEEIGNVQGLSWNVVQRNLTTRLSKIDKEKCKIAKEILNESRLQPLKENSFKPHGK